MSAGVQMDIFQALQKPSAPRVHVHVGCGGFVLHELGGGRCLECGAYPLSYHPHDWSAGLYVMAGETAARAA